SVRSIRKRTSRATDALASMTEFTPNPRSDSAPVVNATATAMPPVRKLNATLTADRRNARSRRTPRSRWIRGGWVGWGSGMRSASVTRGHDLPRVADQTSRHASERWYRERLELRGRDGLHDRQRSRASARGPVEDAVREATEPLDRRWLEVEADERAAALRAHPARFAEHLEVMADGGLGDVTAGGEVTRA